jgi:hypothetical protein
MPKPRRRRGHGEGLNGVKQCVCAPNSAFSAFLRDSAVQLCLCLSVFQQPANYSVDVQIGSASLDLARLLA